MAYQRQSRRGTTIEHATFTGAPGEVTVDTTQNIVVVHDGITAGGHPGATKVQGDKADTAVQPGDLGTAAATDASAYATAAQGAKADTAIQPAAIGTSVQGYDADTLKADAADKLTAGFTATLNNDGTQSSSTYTPDVDTGNFKVITNGGAFTLAPPSPDNDEVITLDMVITNNASAGAITVTGWSFVAGDAFDTTNGNKFACRAVVYDLGGTETSVLSVVALQ